MFVLESVFPVKDIDTLSLLKVSGNQSCVKLQDSGEQIEDETPRHRDNSQPQHFLRISPSGKFVQKLRRHIDSKIG